MATNETTEAKKSLAEIEEANAKSLEQFIIVMWKPNPVTHSIKVILDDGTIQFYIKDEKFMSLIENVLMENCSENTYKNINRIKSSLDEYSGMFYYDRANDVFAELTAIEAQEKISQMDVLKKEQEKIGDGSLFSQVRQDDITNKLFMKDLLAEEAKTKKSKFSLQNVMRTFSVGGKHKK